MWRAPEKTESQAAAPACGGGAWPGTPEPQAPPVWRAPEGPEGTGGLRTGPGCSARGRWRGLATAPVSGGGSWPGHTPAHQVPPVWRAPEGAEGLAAVPVGGGGAWPGHTPAHQVPPVWRAPEGPEAWLRRPWAAARPGRASRSTTPSHQARVWRSRGRAAAHGHNQQPGPTAGSDGARNTSGATNTNTDTTKRAGTIRFRPALNAQWRSAARDNCRQRTTGQ